MAWGVNGRGFAILGWFSVLTAHAGSVDDAIVSVMRLSEWPNYSWLATVDDDARTYEIVGQTSKAGYTRVKMPVVNAVRRRLGRGATDNQAELIFHGNVNCVIATDQGWLTIDQLPTVVDPAPVLGTHSVPGSAATTGIISLSKVDDDRPERGYSNLQLGVSHPHEELGVIVTSSTDLQMEANTLTGKLTDLGAQLLLVHDGQDEITPVRATGSFKIWLHASEVERYEVTLEGAIHVRTALGSREIEVHQHTVTVLKDVGTTAFEVPEEAKQKLR